MSRISLGLSSFFVLATLGSRAVASSAAEFPDNGVAQFSRGGAWVATATDPIAGYYNPAALSTQPTSFGIGANITMQKICFTRRGPGDTDVGPGSGIHYEEVCNKNAGVANAIPNAAFNWRASEKLALGLTITPPSSYGTLQWPDLVPTDARKAPIPAPQRYLSLLVKGTVLWPTLAVSYSVTDDFHVGAGFVAGIAVLELQSMSVSQAGEVDSPGGDKYSTIKVKDLFVPGFVAGALWSASSRWDFGAWYRMSDKIRAKGDLTVVWPYFTEAGAKFTDPSTVKSEDAVGKDAAKVTLTIPMEARIGARWHLPRKPATGLAAEKQRHDAYPTRDPLRDDLYDFELDLTWANNSAADKIQIRFPAGIAVTPGEVPQNSDRPTGYKDSFGARLGMQYNAIRDRMGVRVGSWVETSATDPDYLTVTGVAALRGGFGGGLVFRVGIVDAEMGYQHMWNAGLDNGGDGKIKAIAGSPASSGFRSYDAVNGGSVTQHADVFSIGAVARF